MTEEEKKAVNNLYSSATDVMFNVLYSQEQIEKDIKTALNLIQKQQEDNELLEEEIKFHNLRIDELTEENEKLNKLNKKYIEYSEIYKAQEAALERKDKIIDKITKKLEKDSKSGFVEEHTDKYGLVLKQIIEPVKQYIKQELLPILKEETKKDMKVESEE